MKKRNRKPAEEFDRSKPIPLSDVINFGPVTLAEFESMGITTLDQIEDLGLEEAARRWVEYYPERLNVNAFIGLIATLDGISWSKVSANQRSRARALANLLRRELNLPLVMHARSKRKK